MGCLEGKVAIVTGAARGLGAATARLFVSEGAEVVIGDVREELGNALADELGTSCRYVNLDVTSAGAWDAAVALAQKDFGGLDILVNNAGLFELKSIERTSYDDYMRIVSVNQIGTFIGIKSSAGALKARGGGAIVNVSSVQGLVGISGGAAYTSSKFAIRGLTKVAALELGQYGIRANSVHPAGMATPMVARPEINDFVPDIDENYRGNPIPRIGQPSEIAELILFLASDKSSYCTGAEFVADGGAYVGPMIPGMA